MSLHVVRDHNRAYVRRRPVATIPPVPQGVISDETARKMLRAMVERGRMSSSRLPISVLIVVIVALATMGGLLSVAIALIGS